MIKGILDAAAGMLVRSVRQDILANNLANANTTAYKRDRLFQRQLLDQTLFLRSQKQGNPVDRLEQDRRTIFRQGPLRRTGNDLDAALSGRGFFVISTPRGERYTRNGNFYTNNEGILVTAEGYPVQGEGGDIQLGTGKVSIDNAGIISQNGLEVDRLQLVDFGDTTGLRKEGNSLFRQIRPDVTAETAAEVHVIQGSLEQGTVNIMKAMTEMIEIQRSFQAAQKTIHAQDETLAKAINEVGAGVR
jgi:flagellar basal-body rod protein FlgG